MCVYILFIAHTLELQLQIIKLPEYDTGVSDGSLAFPLTAGEAEADVLSLCAEYTGWSTMLHHDKHQ